MTRPASRTGNSPAWKLRLLDRVQHLAHEHHLVHRRHQHPSTGTHLGEVQARRLRLKELRIARAESELHARVAGLNGERIAEARWRGLRGTGTHDRLLRLLKTPNMMRELVIGALVDDLWLLERMAIAEALRVHTTSRVLFESTSAAVEQYHHAAARRWTRATAVADGVGLNAEEQQRMWAGTAQEWHTIAVGTMRTYDVPTLAARWRRYLMWPDAALLVDYADRLDESGAHPTVRIPHWDMMLAHARRGIGR
ncbi:hypothetical protein ABIA39_007536 [Nocardia sp. GAS34]|uniref:hypothetical protein n=1 Tax=unclassified Nocardia TaxID=2637762 RepID=UPI003D1E89CD